MTNEDIACDNCGIPADPADAYTDDTGLVLCGGIYGNACDSVVSGKLYNELTFPEPGYGLGHRVPSCPDCGIAVIMESDDIHYCR